MKHVAPAVCLACLLVFASTYAFGQGFSQPQPRCCVCNQILFGDYLTIDGRYYHRDHFLCEYCKKPIRDTYLQADHKYYHAVCYEQHVMVVCAICKRAIGSDDKQDEWGNCYHARHFSEYKQCDFCGRLIFGGFAAGQRHFPDGRDLCGMCAATSVTTVAAAETLMVRAGRYLAAD
ncbi:MAG TPA: LIM domain-containing protein, partial [Candidatus Krumholzibacteria bacterium]|nr:LIM domain-containing protein [Candidatus Krumholzibacteria bacterium]